MLRTLLFSLLFGVNSTATKYPPPREDPGINIQKLKASLLNTRNGLHTAKRITFIDITPFSRDLNGRKKKKSEPIRGLIW